MKLINHNRLSEMAESSVKQHKSDKDIKLFTCKCTFSPPFFFPWQTKRWVVMGWKTGWLPWHPPELQFKSMEEEVTGDRSTHQLDNPFIHSSASVYSSSNLFSFCSLVLSPFPFSHSVLSVPLLFLFSALLFFLCFLNTGCISLFVLSLFSFFSFLPNFFLSFLFCSLFTSCVNSNFFSFVSFLLPSSFSISVVFLVSVYIYFCLFFFSSSSLVFSSSSSCSSSFSSSSLLFPSLLLPCFFSVSAIFHISVCFTSVFFFLLFSSQFLLFFSFLFFSLYYFDSC